MITNISSDAMIIRLMPERRAWKELDFENLKWNVEKLSALLPEGCAFRPRCPHASPECLTTPPLQSMGEGHLVRCWKPLA